MATVYKRTQDQGKKGSCWYIGYKDHRGKRRTRKGFTDRKATQQLAFQLDENARQVREGLKPGPVDSDGTLSDIVTDFERHLSNRDLTSQRVAEVLAKVSRVFGGCGFKRLVDCDSSEAEQFLALLRSEGMSKQTSNHYTKTLKQFGNWVVKSHLTTENPFSDMPILNVQTDRRHDRRPLAAEEFARLVRAAESGKSIESISGVDRAMMYIISGWTGYRKAEIGSLTLRSFNLEGDQPTVTVEASYSKRRMRDTQVLHATVIERLNGWLAEKKLEPNELLFPVSGKVPNGKERKTAKMMRRDLTSARKIWLGESTSDDDFKAREASDFLCYQSHDGLYADFHANRHTFITNLGKAGVSPKTAQSLARHSDIRLTMNVYTHTDIAEKAEAIGRLPGLWECSGSAPGSQNVANGQSVSDDDNEEQEKGESSDSPEVVSISEFDATCQPDSADVASTPQRIRTSNLRFRSFQIQTRPHTDWLRTAVFVEFADREFNRTSQVLTHRGHTFCQV